MKKRLLLSQDAYLPTRKQTYMTTPMGELKKQISNVCKKWDKTTTGLVWMLSDKELHPATDDFMSLIDQAYTQAKAEFLTFLKEEDCKWRKDLKRIAEAIENCCGCSEPLEIIDQLLTPQKEEKK